MESTPVFKRRKLNSAVNKPFKSPLRTQSVPSAPPSASTPLSPEPPKDCSDETPPSAEDSAETGVPLSTRQHKRYPRSSLGTAAFSATSSIVESATSPEIQQASRAIRTLELRLAKMSQDMDTVHQALRLVTSNKDTELNELTIKWRKAARQAAEEVFADARDKVNRMGGVGAWREKQREAAEFSKWDDTVGRHDEKQLYDEDGELIARRQPEKAENFDDEWIYDAEGDDTRNHDEGRDDDTFTMDMMLKMLNIDIGLIGYDKDRQRWLD